MNGEEADRQKAAGDFKLRAELPDGTTIEAAVHQSALGPAKAVTTHGGMETPAVKGFVA